MKHGLKCRLLLRWLCLFLSRPFYTQLLPVRLYWRKRIGPQLQFFLLLFPLLLLCLSGCREPKQQAKPLKRKQAQHLSSVFLTWSTTGQAYPDIPLPTVEAALPPGACPAAGIVSHHLLAGSLIDSWFRTLAAVRRVQTFFILSPRHWELGVEWVSLTAGTWKTAAGTVESDPGQVAALCRSLDAQPEQEPFYYEHGVSTLIPFIKAYFPDARVVAIAYPVEHAVQLSRIQHLWKALSVYFTREKQQQNFLLISADFSHHSGLSRTLSKDTRSSRFLQQPELDTWILANSDNPAGMYCLAAMSTLAAEPVMTVLFHSNSYALSGQGEEDITSYFFTFLFDKACVN